MKLNNKKGGLDSEQYNDYLNEVAYILDKRWTSMKKEIAKA